MREHHIPILIGAFWLVAYYVFSETCLGRCWSAGCYLRPAQSPTGLANREAVKRNANASSESEERRGSRAHSDPTTRPTGAAADSVVDPHARWIESLKPGTSAGIAPANRQIDEHQEEDGPDDNDGLLHPRGGGSHAAIVVPTRASSRERPDRAGAEAYSVASTSPDANTFPPTSVNSYRHVPGSNNGPGENPQRSPEPEALKA